MEDKHAETGILKKSNTTTCEILFFYFKKKKKKKKKKRSWWTETQLELTYNDIGFLFPWENTRDGVEWR